MSQRQSPAPRPVVHRRWRSRLLAGSAVAVLAVGGSVTVAMASTGSHATSNLQSINVSPYKGILANSKGFSLYVLSVEKGAKLHCTSAACLKAWPPYLVKDSVKSISKGKGVKGKVGFVARSSTLKQVTFNSYPVYRFAGDTGAKETNGEGIVADGGTWTLASAGATGASSTPVSPKALVISETVTPYSDVLARSNGDSLYALSNESGGTLHCTGSCLSLWPPLLVSSSLTSIVVGSGVDGTIGFVARTSTTKQVTFNGYPVYTYAGDSGAAQCNGEGIVADGGTWDLVDAAATTPGATQIPPASSSADCSGSSGPPY